jgi:hypothetical protein
VTFINILGLFLMVSHKIRQIMSKHTKDNIQIHQISDHLEKLNVILTTDHYLVVAKLRKRIAVSTQAKKKFDLERPDLKKLNNTEAKEKYQMKIAYRSVALENLNEMWILIVPGKVSETK